MSGLEVAIAQAALPRLQSSGETEGESPNPSNTKQTKCHFDAFKVT